jgi:cytidylate kinase
LIIAIDGPAGSGKTTVGRMIAARLAFALVDTGLFYRAVTVEARQRKISSRDELALVEMTRGLRIDINTSSHPSTPTLVSVDGRDITHEALDPAIARDLAEISQLAGVRSLLTERQRAYGTTDAVVLGRDIGTVIFPHAEFKFFFTASTAERVARRKRELDSAAGGAVSEALLEQEVQARDRADSEREIAPLRPAPDAIIVATDGKSVHQVFQEVMDRLPASR